jgi:hypothetical protein
MLLLQRAGTLPRRSQLRLKALSGCQRALRAREAAAHLGSVCLGPCCSRGLGGLCRACLLHLRCTSTSGGKQGHCLLAHITTCPELVVAGPKDSFAMWTLLMSSR